MKRFSKPLFLIGFSIACVAFIASGLFFAQASDRGKGKVPHKAATQIQSPAGGAIVVEDFPYAMSDLAIVGAGTGWVVHSGTTNPINVVSPGLTYSGYAGSGVGNAVSSVATGIDMSRQFSPVGSDSLYTSFLVNVSNSTTTGDYIFHYLTFGSTSFFRGRVFVRKDAATTNFAFGLSRASGDIAYTGTNYMPNTTYLVVLKYTFVAGATNDTVELFVDPTPGSSEPAATLSAPADATNGDPANLDAIAIRQGGSTTGSTQVIDGIRVATTWADAVAAGARQKANVDMNGDGRTDFVILRPAGSSFTANSMAADRKQPRPRRARMLADFERRMSGESLLGGTQAEWWGKYNDAPGGFKILWGLAFEDDFISADFDGDEADDIALWRSGDPGEAGFYSINSGDLTFRFSQFGQTNDDPAVVGDYDGDGIDDPAVFRCPPVGSPPSQCYFFYRGSLNNPSNGVTYVPWGFGDNFDYVPYPGDFNGDGKHDFCVQDLKNPPQAVFWLQLNGTQTHEVIHWGLTNDLVVPGDFDGDGNSDFTVRRIEGLDNHYTFYTLYRSGGVRIVNWGRSPDDVVPGDYDGDGSTDIAIYRWDSNNPRFWILPSNGDPHWTFAYGIFGDVPLANWYVQ